MLPCFLNNFSFSVSEHILKQKEPKKATLGTQEHMRVVMCGYVVSILEVWYSAT